MFAPINAVMETFSLEQAKERVVMIITKMQEMDAQPLVLLRQTMNAKTLRDRFQVAHS
jgi:hypothetical protein